MGWDRIGGRDRDAIGFRYFARVRPHQLASAGDESRPRRIDANAGEETRIFLGVAQAVDAVTMYAAHRAGIEVGPDALRAEFSLGPEKFFGDGVERLVPGNTLQRPAAPP